MLFIQAVKLLNCHTLFEMSIALKYTLPSRSITAFLCFLLLTLLINRSRDSSVGIMTRLRLLYRGIVVRFPTEAGDFYILRSIQTRSGTHPASYTKAIGGKATGALRRPLTTI